MPNYHETPEFAEVWRLLDAANSEKEALIAALDEEAQP